MINHVQQAMDKWKTTHPNNGLPVMTHLNEIFEKIKNNDISCVEAKTGSGKTTAISVFAALMGLDDTLLNESATVTEGYNIVVVSPTVTSVKSMYNYIKKYFGHIINVGYACSGDVKYNPKTRLAFVTAGHLRRLIIRTGGIAHFNLLDLDEAHVTSKDYNSLTESIKYIWPTRKFKLLISSATLCTETISDTWWNQVVFTEIDVPTYPVNKVFHDRSYKIYKDDKIIVKDASKVVEKLNKQLSEGHLLVFIPGVNMINQMYDELFKPNRGLENCNVVCIHSQIPQIQITESITSASMEEGARTIFLATDAAESSITIPDVCCVIDLCQQKLMDSSKDGMTSILKTCRASKNAMGQRMGRTGRTMSGIYYRMSKQIDVEGVAPAYNDEMKRAPVFDLTIEAIFYGHNPEKLYKTYAEKIKFSKTYLTNWGLILADGTLSLDAQFVVGLPVSIQYGIMIKKTTDDRDLMLAMVSYVATLEAVDGRSLFFYPKREKGENGLEYDSRIENYKDNNFRTYMGDDDLETNMNIMKHVFENIDISQDMRFKSWQLSKYCKTHHLNAKTVKASINLFRRLFVKLRLKFSDWLQISEWKTIHSKILKIATEIFPKKYVATRKQTKFQGPDGRLYMISNKGSVMANCCNQYVHALTVSVIDRGDHFLRFLSNVFVISTDESESESESESGYGYESESESESESEIY
jgi:HrpA-like RNA helicase